MKQNNIHVIDTPEREEEQEIENLFEKLMMENYPDTESPNQEELKEAHHN